MSALPPPPVFCSSVSISDDIKSGFKRTTEIDPTLINDLLVPLLYDPLAPSLIKIYSKPHANTLHHSIYLDVTNTFLRCPPAYPLLMQLAHTSVSGGSQSLSTSTVLALLQKELIGRLKSADVPFSWVIPLFEAQGIYPDLSYADQVYDEYKHQLADYEQILSQRANNTGDLLENVESTEDVQAVVDSLRQVLDIPKEVTPFRVYVHYRHIFNFLGLNDVEKHDFLAQLSSLYPLLSITIRLTNIPPQAMVDYHLKSYQTRLDDGHVPMVFPRLSPDELHPALRPVVQLHRGLDMIPLGAHRIGQGKQLAELGCAGVDQTWVLDATVTQTKNKHILERVRIYTCLKCQGILSLTAYINRADPFVLPPYCTHPSTEPDPPPREQSSFRGGGGRGGWRGRGGRGGGYRNQFQSTSTDPSDDTADNSTSFIRAHPAARAEGLCGGTKWAHNPDQSTCRDSQYISVADSTSMTLGGIPLSMNILILDDLCDTVNVGDEVTIIGQLLYFWSGERPEHRMNVELLLVANNIAAKRNSTGLGLRSAQTPAPSMSSWGAKSGLFAANAQDMEVYRVVYTLLKTYYQWPLLLRALLVASIAPGLCGMDIHKLSVLLVLVGGVDKQDDTGMRIRGTSHLLMVGPPGVGKSHLMRSSAQLAPRAVLTTGSGTSSAGLTVAATIDSTTGTWTLEAGALVIANGGVCCIDEFGTMRETDRSAIHEAMEQQTVSVAKAGIITTIHSKTSVVAAQNPHRTPKPCDLSTYTGIAPPLLSRFDIILVTGENDESTDRRVARSILSSRFPIPSRQELQTGRAIAQARMLIDFYSRVYGPSYTLSNDGSHHPHRSHSKLHASLHPASSETTSPFIAPAVSRHISATAPFTPRPFRHKSLSHGAGAGAKGNRPPQPYAILREYSCKPWSFDAWYSVLDREYDPDWYIYYKSQADLLANGSSSDIEHTFQSVRQSFRFPHTASQHPVDFAGQISHSSDEHSIQIMDDRDHHHDDELSIRTPSVLGACDRFGNSVYYSAIADRFQPSSLPPGISSACFVSKGYPFDIGEVWKDLKGRLPPGLRSEYGIATAGGSSASDGDGLGDLDMEPELFGLQLQSLRVAPETIHMIHKAPFTVKVKPTQAPQHHPSTSGAPSSGDSTIHPRSTASHVGPTQAIGWTDVPGYTQDDLDHYRTFPASCQLMCDIRHLYHIILPFTDSTKLIESDSGRFSSDSLSSPHAHVLGDSMLADHFNNPINLYSLPLPRPPGADKWWMQPETKRYYIDLLVFPQLSSHVSKVQGSGAMDVGHEDDHHSSTPTPSTQLSSASSMHGMPSGKQSQTAAYDALLQGNARPQPISPLTTLNEIVGRRVYISPFALKCYLSYINAMLRPTIPPIIVLLIKNYYTLRRAVISSSSSADASSHDGQQQHVDGDGLASVRVIDSLVRLTQAHAKLLCRNICTPLDAITAISLLHFSHTSIHKFTGSLGMVDVLSFRTILGDDDGNGDGGYANADVLEASHGDGERGYSDALPHNGRPVQPVHPTKSMGYYDPNRYASHSLADAMDGDQNKPLNFARDPFDIRDHFPASSSAAAAEHEPYALDGVHDNSYGHSSQFTGGAHTPPTSATRVQMTTTLRLSNTVPPTPPPHRSPNMINTSSGHHGDDNVDRNNRGAEYGTNHSRRTASNIRATEPTAQMGPVGIGRAMSEFGTVEPMSEQEQRQFNYRHPPRHDHHGGYDGQQNQYSQRPRGPLGAPPSFPRFIPDCIRDAVSDDQDHALQPAQEQSFASYAAYGIDVRLPLIDQSQDGLRYTSSLLGLEYDPLYRQPLLDLFPSLRGDNSFVNEPFYKYLMHTQQPELQQPVQGRPSPQRTSKGSAPASRSDNSRDHSLPVAPVTSIYLAVYLTSFEFLVLLRNLVTEHLFMAPQRSRAVQERIDDDKYYNLSGLLQLNRQLYMNPLASTDEAYFSTARASGVLTGGAPGTGFSPDLDGDSTSDILAGPTFICSKGDPLKLPAVARQDESHRLSSPSAVAKNNAAIGECEHILTSIQTTIDSYLDLYILHGDGLTIPVSSLLPPASSEHTATRNATGSTPVGDVKGPHLSMPPTADPVLQQNTQNILILHANLIQILYRLIPSLPTHVFNHQDIKIAILDAFVLLQTRRHHLIRKTPNFLRLTKQADEQQPQGNQHAPSILERSAALYEHRFDFGDGPTMVGDRFELVTSMFTELNTPVFDLMTYYTQYGEYVLQTRPSPPPPRPVYPSQPWLPVLTELKVVEPSVVSTLLSTQRQPLSDHNTPTGLRDMPKQHLDFLDVVNSTKHYSLAHRLQCLPDLLYAILEPAIVYMLTGTYLSLGDSHLFIHASESFSATPQHSKNLQESGVIQLDYVRRIKGLQQRIDYQIRNESATSGDSGINSVLQLWSKHRLQMIQQRRSAAGRAGMGMEAQGGTTGDHTAINSYHQPTPMSATGDRRQSANTAAYHMIKQEDDGSSRQEHPPPTTTGRDTDMTRGTLTNVQQRHPQTPSIYHGQFNSSGGSAGGGSNASSTALPTFSSMATPRDEVIASSEIRQNTFNTRVQNNAKNHHSRTGKGTAAVMTTPSKSGMQSSQSPFNDHGEVYRGATQIYSPYNTPQKAPQGKDSSVSPQRKMHVLHKKYLDENDDLGDSDSDDNHMNTHHNTQRAHDRSLRSFLGSLSDDDADADGADNITSTPGKTTHRAIDQKDTSSTPSSSGTKKEPGKSSLKKSTPHIAPRKGLGPVSFSQLLFTSDTSDADSDVTDGHDPESGLSYLKRLQGAPSQPLTVASATPVHTPSSTSASTRTSTSTAASSSRMKLFSPHNAHRTAPSPRLPPLPPGLPKYRPSGLGNPATTQNTPPRKTQMGSQPQQRTSTGEPSHSAPHSATGLPTFPPIEEKDEPIKTSQEVGTPASFSKLKLHAQGKEGVPVTSTSFINLFDDDEEEADSSEYNIWREQMLAPPGQRRLHDSTTTATGTAADADAPSVTSNSQPSLHSHDISHHPGAISLLDQFDNDDDDPHPQ